MFIRRICDTAPPTSCINPLHTGNGGLSWCLNGSSPWSVGLSIQDEATDVARSAPQGAHYHADGIRKFRQALWYGWWVLVLSVGGCHMIGGF